MLNHIKMTQSCPVTQGGSALIVALVFLLIMTLIGTTAMQGTTQQERMAGNYLDRMKAFQVAEGTLIQARRATPPMVPTSSLPNNDPAGQQPETFWEPTTPLPDCLPTVPSLNPPQPCLVQGYADSFSPPSYAIEKLSGMSQSGGIMCRYTARATGGSGDAEVILEAVVECE